MASIEAGVRQAVLDSRGNPTVEVEVVLDDGSAGRAGVPSGASTGASRPSNSVDGGTEYGGKVTRAVDGVVDEIQLRAAWLRGRRPAARGPGADRP